MYTHYIDLQFSTQNSLGADIIRTFTWSEYSHVDIVLPDGELLGARMNGGVRVRPANYANFTKVGRYRVMCSKEVHDKVLEFALAQVGKPYDTRGILNMGFHSRQWKSDDRAWFCSELVAAAFDAAGFPLVIIDEADKVTPRDLTTSVRAKLIKTA